MHNADYFWSSKDVPRLKLLVAGISQLRSRYDPTPLRVRFVGTNRHWGRFLYE